MGKILICLLSIILFVNGLAAYGEERFPDERIKGDMIELYPSECMQFNTYVQKDLETMKKYEWWSTLHPLSGRDKFGLDKFTLTTIASSTLGERYQSGNLCDGKAETAWVEGTNGSGIGEWVKISIDAYSSVSEYTSTPFALDEIGVIPGYSKSPKTWMENNRVKKLLVVAHSPRIASHEWVVYQLNLKDEAKLQVFVIPDGKVGYSLDNMKKEIWIKIEDVYKGTKYDDTCISEFVAAGSYTN